MSLVFFLFITTLFLFFFANFILSPEKNPLFAKLMEAEDTRDREITAAVVVGLCNAAGIVLAVCLVAVVPFFRALAVIAMAGLVGHFFYRKYCVTVKETSETVRSSLCEGRLVDDLSPLAQIDADRDRDQRVDDSGPITHP